MSELIEKTVVELTNSLKAKECSAEEVTNSYLKNIEANHSLGGFLEVWREQAVDEARKADNAGPPDADAPLRGVPIAIKDIFVTDTGTSTCGSQFLKSFNSPFTATCLQKLKDAGAIVIGKTNLDEFAMGSSTENSAYAVAKNPWDDSRVPGGSSGGSALAVAARMAPAALGTDTGGSIRQPASFCGITGLKPTYGRVSRYGLIAFASSLDQAGPMARTAEDCALIGRIMSGADNNDSTSVKKEISQWETPIEDVAKGLKIGIPKEYFIDGIEPAVSEAVTSTIKKFEELGATFVDISLPNTEHAVSVYYIIAPAEASSNLARFDGVRYGSRAENIESLQDLYFTSRSKGFGPEVKRRILIGTYVLSSGYYDAYYLRAQKVRRLIQNDFHTAFENSCDVILSPTAPTTAFPIGEKTDNPLQMYLNDVFTIPTSLAGLPALSMPCGFDEKNLPIGVQLIGKAWHEHQLLSLANAYQQVTDWHSKAPSLSGGAS